MEENICRLCFYRKTNFGEGPYFCIDNTEVKHEHIFCLVAAGFVHPKQACDKFMHTESYAGDLSKRLSIRNMTHDGVISEFIKYAKSKGWDSSKLNNTGSSFSGVPDLILCSGNLKQGKTQLLSIEVKPGNCSVMELRRGVGQCVFHLSENWTPYLVTPLAFEETLTVVLSKIKLIGLISYSYSSGLMLFKHSYGSPL